MLYTTLDNLKKFNACTEGLNTLIASLPVDHTETSEISLAHILKSNGLEHAIWALRTQEKRYAVEFAVGCAEHVLLIFECRHLNDNRPRQAIEAAKAWLKDPSEENRLDVAHAATNAAYAADAAYAHAAAAHAATNAAYAADAAYAHAAYAHAAAAHAAAAAYAAYVAPDAAEQKFQEELFLKVVS